MTLPRAFDVLLLDVEGTITPIDFVHGTLFPFARRHIRAFVEQHHDDHAVQQDLAHLRSQYQTDVTHGLAPPAWHGASHEIAAIERYIHWLMDHDRKVASLKSLQGKVWEGGYANGTLQGRIFRDVLPALQRLQHRKKSVYLFSSGSVLAQQLLVAHTEEGDLRRYIRGYFDTTTGPKGARKSYEVIAATIGIKTCNMLFISDALAEIDAAHATGMQVLLSRRPGNATTEESTYSWVESFDVLEPEMVEIQ